MKDSFLTVVSDFKAETVIEKSVFICRLFHVEREEEVKKIIAEIKKKHYDATHNCWAYVLDAEGNDSRFFDDGEPQGTAGMPMLDALKKSGVGETLAVVTRYFGGIKLGAGGLVRAYGGCVADALKSADVKSKTLSCVFDIKTDYDKFSALLRLTSSFSLDAEILNQNFDEGVSLSVAVKKSVKEDFIKRVSETFAGKVEPVLSGEKFYVYKG
ncbi:MAG: YigZ family protein [Clostridia bacterium]|nr:YigZ family protein [Clostridia bacterium]